MPLQGDFAQGLPIYVQILQDIRQKIAAGQWPAGMRMPPVRELAVEFGVNPNTMQRSLAELEREGLVYTERTTGRYITSDAGRIEQIRADMADGYAGQYYGQMYAIGYGTDDMAAALRRAADSEQKGGTAPRPQDGAQSREV